ncbi:hypothetical protein TNCV_4960591 [Trichonephila clavipes]|uniref:Uncharacterized protein n=1 Tax=Trichonephila clavipes TaxID=2585209 RepID=A0A8X6VMY1_TRICX|nr:hypothetical protein TNCV_4960591 [Trichonephila clavipes]
MYRTHTEKCIYVTNPQPFTCVSWGKLPTRTTQPTCRISTLTSTSADFQLKTRGRTTNSLLIDACNSTRLLLWLGVQDDLLNIGIKYNMINGRTLNFFCQSLRITQKQMKPVRCLHQHDFEGKICVVCLERVTLASDRITGVNSSDSSSSLSVLLWSKATILASGRDPHTAMSVSSNT